MRIMSGGPCLHYDCPNRNSFGYCKTTVCINEHYQQEQWGSPSTTNKSETIVKKPQTNADRIRSMADEELADYFSELSCWPNAGREDCHGMANCMDCWLDWLKQEAEGER